MQQWLYMYTFYYQFRGPVTKSIKKMIKLVNTLQN